MLVIFMILGFALATQVRAQRSDPLEGLSEQDLVTVLDELSTQEQNLRNRRGELSSELDDLRSAASEADAREQATRKAQTQAQIAAGTVAVHGPGVTVCVTDPSANLTPTQFVQTLGSFVTPVPRHRTQRRASVTRRRSLASWSIVVDGTRSPLRIRGRCRRRTDDCDSPRHSSWFSGANASRGATVTITPVNDLSISSIATPKPPQFATYG